MSVRIGDRELDAAVAAILRAGMFRIKDGKEAQFREDMRFVLIKAAEAARDEAREHLAGIAEDDPLALLAEAVHTAWRKGCDSPLAPAIHELIAQMAPEHWCAYLVWLHYCLGEVGYQPPEPTP